MSVLYLRPRGLDTSMMRPFRVVRGNIYSNARTEAQDPHFTGLVSRRITPKQGAVITATPIPVETFLSLDSSALPVDCKKITKRVSEKFKKEYKISNQLMRSGDP
ncbi:hypothetical protein F4679DRAFT_373709 [Xylaria curta]|nr:hypothetical protein F4679DRAFT_373709 [Xylaria curta]